MNIFYNICLDGEVIKSITTVDLYEVKTKGSEGVRKKRMFTISMIIIISLFIFTGCSIRKTVKDEEVKGFTESIMKSNEKIKELKFYYKRPGLYADLAYDGELNEEDIQSLIDEFKILIDVEFMEKIRDEYSNGSAPLDFGLYIHKDKIRDAGYKYLITSRYHKESIVNDDQDNIDGYETWSILK